MSTIENEIQTLLVNPVAECDVNYYFFVVELPQCDTIVFGEGVYDEGQNQLSYIFSYGASVPEEDTPLKAYMLPVFLEQYIDQDPNRPINLNEAEVLLIEKGNSQPTRKGIVSSPKKVSLFDQDSTPEQPVPENEIRNLVLTVTVYNPPNCDPSVDPDCLTTDFYWVIGMSRSESAEVLNYLNMIPDPDSSTIRCWYTSRPFDSAGIQSDYLAACNGINSSLKYEYQHIRIENRASLPVDYDSAVTFDAALSPM